MYRLIRPLLFTLPPETAHQAVFGMLGGFGALLGAPPRERPRTLAGLRFRGPVGLAAGLDKDGELAAFWPRLGFGFIELGTVTPAPQPGNPKPRLFRLSESGALINRMGFNNGGVDALVERLQRLTDRPCPIGVNVGKQRTTSLEDAAADYATCAQRAAPVADYLVVNVSSPNTPGLRQLQDASSLREIVGRTTDSSLGKPVFVKLSPDLEAEALEEAVAVAERAGAAGFIAANTTLSRPEGLGPRSAEAGGLSGAPLHPRTCATVAAVRRATRLPLIGVGGVHSVESAQALLDAGANLIQLYTGLIYQGPSLVRTLHEALP